MWSWIWQQRFWMSWRLERIEELQQPNGLVMKAWVTASRCYSENSLTLEVGYEMVEAGLTQQLIDIWVFAQSWPIINNTVLQTMNHWGLSDPSDLLSCHAYFFFLFLSWMNFHFSSVMSSQVFFFFFFFHERKECCGPRMTDRFMCQITNLNKYSCQSRPVIQTLVLENVPKCSELNEMPTTREGYSSVRAGRNK